LRLDFDDVTTHVNPLVATSPRQRTPEGASTPFAARDGGAAHSPVARARTPALGDASRACAMPRGGALTASGLLWRGSETELEDLAEQFAAAVPDGAVSPAALQGYLMKHKRSPVAAVAGAGELLVGENG
jgi:hypothetical protein